MFRSVIVKRGQLNRLPIAGKKGAAEPLGIDFKHLFYVCYYFPKKYIKEPT